MLQRLGSKHAPSIVFWRPAGRPPHGLTSSGALVHESHAALFHSRLALTPCCVSEWLGLRGKSVSASSSISHLYAVRISSALNAGYHVPPILKVQFQNGPVRGIHLETLECNSKAMRALPNAPNYAVLGVEASDGRLFTDIPVEWRRLRRNLLLLGGVLILTAVLILVKDASVGLNFLAAGATRPRDNENQGFNSGAANSVYCFCDSRRPYCQSDHARRLRLAVAFRVGALE